jgi:hypothetical protein
MFFQEFQNKWAQIAWFESPILREKAYANTGPSHFFSTFEECRLKGKVSRDEYFLEGP